MVRENTIVNRSEANETPVSDYLYLQSVDIKEYRTIKDCSVDFQPGLNIIIGKNGVGKTNFMNALNQGINFTFSEFGFGEATLRFLRGDAKLNLIIPKEGELSKEEIGETGIKVSSFRRANVFMSDEFRLNRINSTFSSSIIRHGLPSKVFFINEPVTIELSGNGKLTDKDFVNVVFSGRDKYSYFEKVIFFKILMAVNRIYQTNLERQISINENNYSEIIDQIIYGVFDGVTKLNLQFKKYTPIQQIIADRNVLKYFDKEYGNAIAKNLVLEFEVNGSILPFDSLSDGTKRMFYIISEVAAEETYRFADGVVDSDSKMDRILLIEEPELGIHPHQLQLLMDFLKEQSQYKQIIITTHSPQVLDILKSDELNRIIIASHTPEKGTQLRHLTEKEEAKAKNYMHETGFLSDYWKYSDLESN